MTAPTEAAPRVADRGTCPDCRREVALTKTGELRKHKCEADPAVAVLPAAQLPRVIQDLYAVDAARPRSTQRTLGISALGGCARAAAETILDTPRTNEGDRLAAVIGTAVHDAAERATLARNPFLAKGIDVDVSVAFPDLDLTGHADAFIDGILEDWKTKHDLSPNHKPTRQQRWQVQTYAKGLVDQGKSVRGVRLVFIPRDGRGDECVTWEDDYREDVAIEALLWLDGVREQIAAGIKPAPERVASSFCRDWCSFYDPDGVGSGCVGLTDRPVDVVIDDPDVIDAARTYADGQQLAKQAGDAKEAARDHLVGRSGVAGDLVVSWSSPKPRQVLDEDSVRTTYALAGLPLPVRMETAAPRLSVKPHTPAQEATA